MDPSSFEEVLSASRARIWFAAQWQIDKITNKYPGS